MRIIDMASVVKNDEKVKVSSWIDGSEAVLYEGPFGSMEIKVARLLFYSFMPSISDSVPHEFYLHANEVR